LRYLVWQANEPTNADPDWQEGAIHLEDREAGTSTEIATTSLDYVSGGAFVGSDPPVLELGFEPGAGPHRLYALPPLDSIEAPADARLLDYREFDTALLVALGRIGGPFALLDRTSLTVDPLYESEGGIGWLPQGTEAIAVLEGLTCCTPGQDMRKEAALHYLPFGEAPHVLAERATHGYQVMDAHRVVTSLDLDADLVGHLVVVHSDALQELGIDADVPANTIELDTDDPSLVLYGVTDPDRQGVWMARVAN
jgi:hypothetical protein